VKRRLRLTRPIHRLYDIGKRVVQDSPEGSGAMITLTEAAVDKVREFMSQHEGLALRIYVSKGGCSGFSYGMALDEAREDDQVFEQEGVAVIIDRESLPYLDGIQVDYVNSLMGAGFAIENPNALSTCGCGHSFRTKDQRGAPASCSH
jgi:iron-sulfur cluster assembly protein